MFLIILTKKIERFTVKIHQGLVLCPLFYTFFPPRKLTNLHHFLFTSSLFRFNTIWLVYLHFYLFIRIPLSTYNFLFTSTFAETRLGHKARFSRIFVSRFIQHNDVGGWVRRNTTVVGSHFY